MANKHTVKLIIVNVSVAYPVVEKGLGDLEIGSLSITAHSPHIPIPVISQGSALKISRFTINFEALSAIRF